LTLDFTVAGNNGSINDFAVGDVIIQRGHPTTTARQSLIYTTVADADNPFTKVMTGIDSLAAFGVLANVTLQYGNLNNLDSHDIVPASPGFGLYSDNVYLEGKIVATSGDIGGWTIDTTRIHKNITADRFLNINAGHASYPIGYQLYRNDADLGKDDVKIVQVGGLYAQGDSIAIGTDYGFQIKKQNHDEDGYEDLMYVGDDAVKIAAWNFDAESFYTGTKHITDDYSTTGMTLGSDGTLHSPNFYINDDGEVGVRATLVQAYTGVSNVELLNDIVGVSSASATPDIVKTITLGPYVQANKTLRIKFGLRTTDEFKLAHGQIYRNLVAVGTEQSTLSTSYVTYEANGEDIAGWSAGDDIVLRIWVAPGATAWCNEFHVCGDIAPIVDEITEV